MTFIFSLLYPCCVLFLIHYLHIENAFILKLVPLLISLYFMILLYVSYKKNNFLIFNYAQKFLKKDFSKEEKRYIQKSTFFWLSVCFTNILLHIFFLWLNNEYYWFAYVTFGWYFVFLCGAILHFLHRKVIFLKRQKCV